MSLDELVDDDLCSGHTHIGHQQLGLERFNDVVINRSFDAQRIL